MKLRPEVGEVTAEFAGVSLGDERLDQRLRRIVALAAIAPGESFPEQMQTVADREALYRFLSNPKVSLDKVLGGHLQQTHERLKGRSVVRIVHDTTTFRFPGERDGLGTIQGSAKGFLGHVALAVTSNENREPLGVLGVQPYIHRGTEAHRGMLPGQRVAASRAKSRDEKESSRWEKLAVDVSRTLPVGVRAIHVMDQEADDYDLLAAMDQARLGFVIRASPERQTANNALCAKEVLAQEPARLFRTVSLNPRSPREARATRGRRPTRAERDAELKIRWGKVSIRRLQHSKSDVRELSFWAVHVFEPKPPPGEEPIEWMLFTSEAVNTLTEAEEVVDHYRARWLIEEYFKALKTGCAFEKRQITTYNGLLRALGFFVPMAWRLLVLRHLGRRNEPEPATRAFDVEQLQLLRALLAKRRYSLPSKPTVRDAMLGIAALGGHIPNNGDPGWIVLGRGFTKFVEAEDVWVLAKEAK